MANVTVLPDDYDGLKKEYLVLRKELDEVKQELYVNKRQLKVAEALQLEYQNEIEILQSEENSHRLKDQEKIVHLEENIVHVKSKYSERFQTLESELIAKDEEIEKLKTEVEFLKKSNATQTPSEDSCKLLEELTNLKHENETLLETEEELKLSLEILQKKCFTLEEALSECKEELTSLQEILCCKRDELMEANNLVQKLNDELFCLKSELETYKSKPLNEESKGNSLFAEVDDRRVYLQKTINNMKSEYISIKQERAKHLNTISHLKKENKALCERWKMDVEEKEDDQHMVLKSYKDQIQILGDMLEKYKRDLAVKPVLISSGTFSEIEFYQVMLNNKLKELEDLRDQLKSRGLTHTMLSTALKEANKETRKWRLEATLKQWQLEIRPGDSISESILTEKISEEMEPRMELKQTKKGPHLACKKEEKQAMERDLSDEKQNECSKDVKEVITINDSTDDVQIVESGPHGEQENRPEEHNVKSEPGILKNSDNQEPEPRILENSRNEEPEPEILKNSHDEEPEPEILKTEENTIKTEDIEKTEQIFVKQEPVCLAEKVGDSEGKENVPEKAPRKVTFSQNTVTPKVTDRTALRANCRRIVVPKPIYIPSE